MLWKAISCLCAVLGLLLLIKCASRTAWLLAAFYIAYVVFIKIFVRMSSKREAWLFAAVCLCIVVAVVSVAALNVASIADQLGKDSTLTGRAQIWHAVMSAISTHFVLGYGYGGFWQGGDAANITAAIGWGVTHAHNGFLDLSLQLGLVGLVLLLWTLLRALRDGLTCCLSYPSGIAAWYLGMILLIIVTNLDESSFFTYNTASTILFVMACSGLRKIIAVGRHPLGNPRLLQQN